MTIDIMTAMAAAITLLVVLAAQMAFFWLQDRRQAWLVWVLIPFVTGALGISLFVARWHQPDFFGIGVGYALVIVSFGLIWQAMRIFGGRRATVLPAMGAAALWLALCLWQPFVADLAVRTAVLSMMIAVFCGLAAFELWRGRAERLPSRMAAVVVMSIYAGVMVLRVCLIGVAPYPVGGQPINATWIGIFNLVMFGLLAFFAVLMVSLPKERRELEHRNDAITDPLTGLLNRRAFSAHSQRTLYRSKFGRTRTSLMVLDLDHFKSINDRFGHDSGDQVLRAFAAIAEKNLRSSDVLFRMGGEEFCFVLPETALADAITAAERIRKEFEVSSLIIQGEEAVLSVSIGIATTDFAGFDLEVLLAAADAALYEAKARGRNRVVVAEPTSIKRPREAQAAPRRTTRAV